MGSNYTFFLQTSALSEEHKPCVLTVFGADCTYQKPTEQSPSLLQFTKATESIFSKVMFVLRINRGCLECLNFQKDLL